MSVHEIAIVFIDESVSLAAFSAFRIRNLPDKAQGTKGLGRIFFMFVKRMAAYYTNRSRKLMRQRPFLRNQYRT